MSDNINLLVKKENYASKEQGKIKIFRFIAVGFLAVLLLISIVIYLLNQQLLNSSLDKDRESALNKILVFKDRAANFTIIKNRIENIPKVLNKRVDVYKIINKILGKIPNEIVVDSFGFEDKKISIQTSTNSLIQVDTLINNLVDMAKRKEIIKDLMLDSLDVTEADGKYKVSITIGF